MSVENLPERMLAVQIVEFNKPYEIHHVQTPKHLGDYDMLLKTAVASLCHTDLMVIDGTFPTPLPCTASHEGTGIVIAVGPKVTNFKTGDRVMSGVPRNQCNTCVHCRGPNDWHQYCGNAEATLGITAHGAFAEYHIVDERTSCHIPHSVSFLTAAPMACAGVTSYRAVITSNVEPGRWVAIVGGGGGLGHFAIQFALAKGMKVIAVDARDEGLEVCRLAGAKYVFDAREGAKIVKEINDLTGGGVDAAINVSDHETAATTSCAIIKMHGTLVQIAQPIKISVPFQEVVLRDITIKGSMLAGQEQCQEMLNQAAKFGFKAEMQLFHGLEEVPKMVELSHSGKLKGKAVLVVDKTLV